MTFPLPEAHPITAAPPTPATALDLSLPSAAPQPPASAPADSLASASEEVKKVARWVADTGDNARLPYLLIDKVNATVYAFGPAGQFKASAPALLGMTRGDVLVADNSASMSEMSEQMRVTPAGRFVSKLARDSHGTELLVLDYDASISLHAVVKGTSAEHRAERLNSKTSADNRISFGCINVPTAFYQGVVSPTFAATKGVVYVLPEMGPANQWFAMQPNAIPAPDSGSAPVAPRGSTALNDAQSSDSKPAPVAN
jgi:hypothetical protein